MQMNDGMGGSNTSADFLKGIAHGIAAGGLLGSMFQNLGGMFGGASAGAVGKGAAGIVKGRAKAKQMQTSAPLKGGGNQNVPTLQQQTGTGMQGGQRLYPNPLQGGAMPPMNAPQENVTNPQDQALGYGAIQPNQMGASPGLVAPSFMHPNLPNQPQTRGFPLNTTTGLDEFIRNSAARNKAQNRTQ
jgi:hypothetical protein